MGKIYNPVKFLELLKNLNNIIRGQRGMKFVRIRKHFKGEAGRWLGSHGNKWVKFKEFKKAFITTFWSEQKQEELMRNLMIL